VKLRIFQHGKISLIWNRLGLKENRVTKQNHCSSKMKCALTWQGAGKIASCHLLWCYWALLAWSKAGKSEKRRVRLHAQKTQHKQCFLSSVYEVISLPASWVYNTLGRMRKLW